MYSVPTKPLSVFTRKAITLSLLLGLTTGGTGAKEAVKQPVDFNRDIRPLLSNRCYTCHGPDENKRKAELRLDTREGALADAGGYAAIKPGDPDDSELFYRITCEADDDDRMPPSEKGAPLNAEEIALIKTWIEQNAPYATHWSYVKPERPALPDVTQPDWPKHPIDAFVLARLTAEGLAPSPEADRYTLARRLALDLTGLPPSWEEACRFAEDKADGAYERYVDGLLARPAFGERWARVWLDLARYADSAGYASDVPRTIWAYRDYVIKALNANMPFDQFTLEQLAGDLLENPTEDQLIATAFHRNTMMNTEGGTIDEEFRNAAVVDRANTTMSVWMGTTLGCAQCHTHKFDPITHHEYYRFFSFFNQTEDADKSDEMPVLPLWSDVQHQEKERLQERIAELKTFLDTVTDTQAAEQQTWIDSLSGETEWFPLQPRDVKSEEAKLSIDPAGGIVLENSAAPNLTYTIDLEVPPDTVPLTALRLTVSEKQSKNFVLSRLTAQWVPEQRASRNGRFVRVELPGKGKFIHLAEVQVFSGGENIARTGIATQSTTYVRGEAEHAIDGITGGEFGTHFGSHTDDNDSSPWLEIDLGADRPIDRIVLWNRTDGNFENRLKGYQVSLLDARREVVWTQVPPDVPRPDTAFALDGARDLAWDTALASYEQRGFPAAAVLGAKSDPKTGWAIQGGLGTAQQLIVTLAQPIPAEGGFLRVSLDHHSKFAHHILTHFSLAGTTDVRVLDRARIPPAVQAVVRTSPDRWTDEARARVTAYFRTIAPSLETERKALAAEEKKLSGMKAYTSVPILREVPADKRRKTHVQLRGSYLNLGDEVQAGVPAAFHPLPAGVATNRLALARWLMHPDNPLSARVVINRHWEQLFGPGLVLTSEDFGSQGDLPSHPELLDWLAVDLQEHGWDLKRLLKHMVMSATYRQQSRVTPDLAERDPYNRLLSRGPRVRVSAEMVRDQALAVSGLLSAKMYGPPVKPLQPDLGLKAAFGGATDWKPSAGEDRYRRGVYVLWRRSNPYPSMSTFDAPNREVCTVRRSRTTTPLQALVTLNDPVFLETAQALARRIEAEGGATVEAKAAYGIQQTLVRHPRAEEVDRLAVLYRETVAAYSTRADEARSLAEQPLAPLPEGRDPIAMAGWTVVANVLLNLDEIFMKR